MEAAMTSDCATVTDETLARSAANGDRLAYSALVERYRKLAFSTAYAMLGNRDDAEDVAQEAFVRAYRALPDFDPRRPWGAWIMSIVRNLCRDAIRRRAVRLAFATGHAEPGSHEPSADGQTPESTLIAAERLTELRRAVADLPDHLRAPIVLHYAYGRTYREIASDLGLPESTVVGRLAAAMRRLRRQFAAEASS
ncbi:MAG: RNA polymerase sigma factor [Chthonomonadales bacterium]|nr:RNA polymerase sigma factor [Chthonomonadales bacterium]